MKFTLIVCTYMRAQPLLNLLNSVVNQSLYPDEIIIVDGSTNNQTQEILEKNTFKNLKYYLVSEAQRGLTKQRNFGIDKVSSESQVICFLDDDIVLDKNYFKNLINTYNLNPDALGVGGYISNEAQWKPIENEFKIKKSDFYYDGFIRRDGSRFILRKKLGLDSNVAPGFSPKFSHGRSVGFLPPSGKIYQVEQLMGGASSFPKSIFKTIKFSEYFQGYGLYEDADFSLRLSKKGKLYINTKATLNHYHHESGRPNKYAYGKMVVRNGWYVWRVKNPTPDFNARLKWNFITLILIAIRFTNIFTTKKTLESFTETIGRTVGWLSLFINRPKLERE